MVILANTFWRATGYWNLYGDFLKILECLETVIFEFWCFGDIIRQAQNRYFVETI